MKAVRVVMIWLIIVVLAVAGLIALPFRLLRKLWK